METLEKIARGVSNVTKGKESKEGKVATLIESQTSKLPSDLFLWASLGSMAVSLTFKIFKKNQMSLFVGQWAPSFLLFGVYNKLVKLEGHDKSSREGTEY
ncbi:MAG: hypothetical protein ACK4ND_02430 [Cytophagaceae bacterium]